jgi:ATP-dependent DNA helicase RecG
MNLESPLTEVKGVGPALAKKLAGLGLHSIGDLIDYLPRKYDDYSHITPVAQLKPGKVTIEAAITTAKGRYVRRGMHITEAIATDGTASTRLIWFNQPYREGSIKKGAQYFISGNYELSRQRFSIMNPTLELASDFPVSTARIVPIYKEVKGLTSRQLRTILAAAVQLIRTLPETLPPWLVREQELLPRSEAVMALHFPESGEQLEAARHRFGFEEVFRLTLASLLNKRENAHETSLEIPFKEQLAKDFVASLPFNLTDGQRKVIWQAYLDLQKAQPMNRLIEGDVGSGKTVVATMVSLMALEQGFQVALMAPTELLARQHADTVYKLLEPLGLQNEVTLLVGGLSAAQKKKAHQAIAGGQARFVVGTQALIQEKVDMHKLALIVIDEQHRFGVEQRKTLMGKAGHMPHVMSLTATPIPRSLALTLYGELDVSVLDTKPPGRQPIITQIISPTSKAGLYDKIKQELKGGRQMFVVAPLISESETVVANSAEKLYEQLGKKDFKDFRVALLHGRMKPAEKATTMERFVGHELDILVSTTVIEVGVDVPNATIMLIEGPERFGLAQIHQLRGRVGRGEHQGYCYLMMSDSSAPSRRLRALEASQDGFRLAELDLELRGPGAIYGSMQHGQLDLRVAKLTDTKLIAEARQAAQEFLDRGENVLKYKELAQNIQKLRTVTNLN